MEDARRPNQFTRRLVTYCEMDTVFKKAVIIPHIHSMVGAGDGEVASFNNSDWPNRVDGDRLGNAQHAYSNEFTTRKAHDGTMTG